MAEIQSRYVKATHDKGAIGSMAEGYHLQPDTEQPAAGPAEQRKFGSLAFFPALLRFDIIPS